MMASDLFYPDHSSSTFVANSFLFFLDLGQFSKAAEMCPKVLGINAKLWEDWVFLFAEKGHMQVIAYSLHLISTKTDSPSPIHRLSFPLYPLTILN